MKHWTQTLGVLLTFALCAATFAQQATLKVGDPAPPLVQGEYLKGEPVTEFEAGKVYVLEFWATWCGPCIAAIPHVTELQHEYADDVIVIGQNVWERNDDLPAPFVAKMNDKMDYRVALDDKSTDERGAMATTWMTAAGRNGIPCSMIVDQQGKIAWIGHPMSMAGPLKKIVAGEFDAAAEAAAIERASTVNQQLSDAVKAGDVDKALPLLDEMVELQPELAAQIGGYKLNFLIENGRAEQALVVAAGLVDDADDAQVLNGIAWSIVEPDTKFDGQGYDIALKAAEKANTLSAGKDAAILDTLARVHHVMGDNAKALELQQQAVDHAKEPALIAELKSTLAEYRSAQ